MRYKHAFWIGLPFTVLGIGKAIHKFRNHHGLSCSGDHKHNHMLKFLSWRLGLSAEQQSDLHTLLKKTHSSMDGLKSKRKEITDKIIKSFSQDTFDTDAILKGFDSSDVEQVKSVLASTIAEFHKILTPLQREKVQEHLLKRHAHCHHWC
jgi:Spy/CpxP family protein refolding chaperone